MARGKSRERANILERQLLALDLRKAGLTYRAIASKLGVNHQTAYNDVMNELKRLAAQRSESAEELRQLELEKLDKYETHLTNWAEAGSVEAIKALLKIQERRAKLLGLDAPEKIEHKGDLMTGLVINLGND